MTPDRFRLVVSFVLVIGVASAGIIIGLAFVASFVVGWNGSLTGALATSAEPTDFGELAAGLGSLRPIAIAQAGLVVLVATPVLRVAASVVGFALEGDRLYTALTLAVLVILLSSLFVLR